MLNVAKKEKVKEQPGFLTLRDAFVKAGFKDKTAVKKPFKKKSVNKGGENNEEQK